MNNRERLHESFVVKRRVGVLSRHLAELIGTSGRTGGRVLDVGCGDGQLSVALSQRRPDLQIEGLEVHRRPAEHIPVRTFDGRTLPAEDGAYDVVLFVDVLHHSHHARELLREAGRVARGCVVVKDHTVTGPFAETTLRFMDRVGNARHGVELPYAYWTEPAWHRELAEAGLEIEAWRSALGLYPFPASLLFDRRLHFAARLGAG